MNISFNKLFFTILLVGISIPLLALPMEKKIRKGRKRQAPFGGAPVRKQPCITTMISKNLLDAVNTNDLQTIKELLATDRFHIDTKYDNGETIIMIAIRNGSFKVVKLLIEMGANLNIKNDSQQTAFDIVKQCNRFELADIISSNLKDSESITPLIKAVIQRKTQDVYNLISSGAKIDATGKYGHTAHNYNQIINPTSEQESVDQYDIHNILSRDLFINNRDNDGKTKLIRAVIQNNLKQVKYLIAKGADILIQDNYPFTAYDYAQMGNDKEMCNFFAMII